MDFLSPLAFVLDNSPDFYCDGEFIVQLAEITLLQFISSQNFKLCNASECSPRTLHPFLLKTRRKPPVKYDRSQELLEETNFCSPLP